MIYVVFSKDKKSMKKFKGLPWSYLGCEIGLRHAEGILGCDKRKFIGKEINRIADSIRDNFVDYIGQISEFQTNRVLWYSSRVASKSFSQMIMFHQYVYIKLIESLSSLKENRLFVIDDLRLLMNLKHIYHTNVEVKSRLITDFMNTVLNGIRRSVRFLRIVFHWTVFKLFLTSARPKKGDVLIHSFIDNRAFSRLPGYNDPYFGDLESFLNKNGHNVFRIAPFPLDLKYAFMLKKHFKNIVFLLSYLQLPDFFRVLFAQMSIKRNLREAGNIKDVKILDLLLKDEERNENETSGFKTYLFSYYSFSGLAEKMPSGLSIIYTFENQPWEKMLNLALGRNFKKIAYQHTTIPANLLDFRLSIFEKRSPVPDVILASGPRWLSFLENYYKHSLLEDAGTIRLRHIFSPIKDRNNKKNGAIVVALPISPDIAIALQKQILSCLATGKFNKYKFLIKPHPHLPKSALLSGKFLKYGNCELTEKDLRKLLESSSLMVTSGSTVVFESLSLGVKTLYLIPEIVSAGNEYCIADYLRLAFADDFMEALFSALDSTESKVFNIKEFFSPPDYSVFLKQVSGIAEPVVEKIGGII
ncbi:MAG: hypothetical protein PHV48_01290 [Candidatus Omnitrophica bacterium]|nr:hypothetical protein [Candidatus Omnitrophota bacterium]